MKKMTEDDVRIIRKEYVTRKQAAKSPNVIELANRFGISQNTVRKIALRQTYRWVE